MSEPIAIDTRMPESIPAQPQAPAKVIKLFTPGMVLWVGILLSWPSALVLCLINWFRLSQRARAFTYLIVGSLGLIAMIIYSVSRNGSSGGAGLLGLNLIILALLYSQAKADFGQIHFPDPRYQKASTGQAALIAVLSLIGLVIIVFLIAFAYSMMIALLTPSHGPILPGQEGWLPGNAVFVL